MFHTLQLISLMPDRFFWRRSFFLPLLAVSFFSFSQNVSKRFVINGYAQGTSYSIVYYHNDSIGLKNDVEFLLKQIDSSLSIYKPYSLISRFNNNSGPVKPDQHLKYILALSAKITRETKGIFDITIGRLTEFWGFGASQNKSVNDPVLLKQALACKGLNKIKWSDSLLIKQDACIKLDVNGIAQGYSVDLLAALLETHDIENYVVELGGEIRTKGRRVSSNEPFKLAIEIPGNDIYSASDSLLQIHIPNGAITTSGSYKKYRETNGKKIHHLFDARNGKPVHNEMIAVTVWAPSAVIADGYDNAIMIMGYKKGWRFIEAHPDLAALFIYRNKKGQIVAKPSSRFAAMIIK